MGLHGEKWVRPTSKPPLLLDFTRKQSSLDSDVVRDSSMRDRLSSTSRDVPTVPAPSTTTVSASLTSGNARTLTPARTTSADGVELSPPTVSTVVSALDSPRTSPPEPCSTPTNRSENATKRLPVVALRPETRSHLAG